MKKIKKKRNIVIIKRNVIIIERNKIIQELNKAKTIIFFLQNNLAKQQQNQLSIDQFLQSMKTHSFVVIFVFIFLHALKIVESVKLSDEKVLTDNNKNEFEN